MILSTTTSVSTIHSSCSVMALWYFFHRGSVSSLLSDRVSSDILKSLSVLTRDVLLLPEIKKWNAYNITLIFYHLNIKIGINFSPHKMKFTSFLFSFRNEILHHLFPNWYNFLFKVRHFLRKKRLWINCMDIISKLFQNVATVKFEVNKKREKMSSIYNCIPFYLSAWLTECGISFE